MQLRIQVYELPADFMSRGVGEQLVNYIDRFMEYDENNDRGFWRTYMRIRVQIDFKGPLKRRKKVRIEGGAWAIV